MKFLRRMKETPPECKIKQIIIDKNAFNYALNIGKGTSTEVGFYMIGFVDGEKAYVLDVIEFPYSEKGAVSVVSDPQLKGKISRSTPFGLRIIGTMHKHPDGIGSQYSGIDEKTFINWSKGGDYAHIIFSRDGEDVSGYTVFDEKVVKIDVEILPIDDDLLEKRYIELRTTFPIYVRKGMSNILLRAHLEQTLFDFLRKRLFPIKFAEKDSKIILFEKPTIYLRLPNNRFFEYELSYIHDQKFGDVKNELLKIFNLTEFDEFYTDEGPIDNDISLRDLTNKIIYPRISFEAFIRRIVDKEVKKILDEYLRDLEEKHKSLLEKVVEIEEEVAELEELLEKKINSALSRVKDEISNEFQALISRIEKSLAEIKDSLNNLKKGEGLNDGQGKD